MIKEDDETWFETNLDDLWIYDKLILSRKLGYTCGPAGIDVPKPNFYIVKPCVNVLGLGLGAKKVTLEKYTMHLPHGSFWCEWFEGRHLSVDYRYGEQWLCVEGFKKKSTLIKWDKWVKTDDVVPLPKVLEQFKNKPIINCEFIGGKLIEAHFRSNPDFTSSYVIDLFFRHTSVVSDLRNEFFINQICAHLQQSFVFFSQRFCNRCGDINR